jgi:integrase
VSNRTINIALQRVGRILRLAASAWRDEHEMTWPDRVPHFTMLPETDQRSAYPLSWEEQVYLLRTLPAHLAKMALYKMNSGCREQEVCRLRWDWEAKVPELSTSVFLIPPDFGGRRPNSGVKNREDRLVLLNDVAKTVIDAQHESKLRTSGRRTRASPRIPGLRACVCTISSTRSGAGFALRGEL